MLRIGLLMLTMRSGILRLILKLMLDRRVPLRAKMIIPTAILYLILPIDFLPDIVPIIGWMDDLLAVVISAILFLSLIPRDVLSEYIGGSGARGRRQSDRNTIDGSYRVIDDDDEPEDKDKNAS